MKDKQDSSEKSRILLVDDEFEILDNLGEFLLEQGYKAHTVTNGKAALAYLQETSYDLVVTDIRMPDMSGIDLLRYIKQWHPLIEVILITGYASKDSAIEAVRLGVYDYLEKPFDALELLTSIVNGLEHIKLKRKNDALIQALQTHQEELEQKVLEKTSEVLEHERKLTRIESLRQVLATLAHYINNANSVILANADMCQETPDSSKAIARLIQACLQEGQKITAVMDSLQDVVEKMDIKSVLYVQGSDQMMIDIEAEIERRLKKKGG